MKIVRRKNGRLQVLHFPLLKTFQHGGRVRFETNGRPLGFPVAARFLDRWRSIVGCGRWLLTGRGRRCSIASLEFWFKSRKRWNHFFFLWVVLWFLDQRLDAVMIIEGNEIVNLQIA